MKIFTALLFVTVITATSCTLKGSEVPWSIPVVEDSVSALLSQGGSPNSDVDHRFAFKPLHDLMSGKALTTVYKRPPVLVAIGSFPMLEEEGESLTTHKQGFIVSQPSNGMSAGNQNVSAADISFPTKEGEVMGGNPPQAPQAPTNESLSHVQESNNSSPILSQNMPVSNNSAEVNKPQVATSPPLIDTTPQPNIKPQYPLELQNAIQAVMSVAIKMQSLQQASDKNFLLSPLSVTTALAQMLISSRANVSGELLKFLGIPEDKGQIHDQLGNMLRTIKSDQKGFLLTAASALFVQKDRPLSPVFKETLQNNYLSTIIPVDFQGNDVLFQVNRWVYEATHGKIQGILSRPPSPKAQALVTNALYFNGAWQTPFNALLTVKGKFIVSESEQIDAEFMQGEFEFPYTRNHDLGCSLVGLPYKTGEAVMYIILPDKLGKYGLHELSSRLTATDFMNMVTSTKVYPITMVLPKMSLETAKSLKSPLKELGVHSLFEPVPANTSSPDMNVVVDDILHKVVIDVTETGTEAAAVSSTSIDYINDSVIFRADRPFMFVIVHTRTGTPLFWASILRPSSVVESNNR